MGMKRFCLILAFISVFIIFASFASAQTTCSSSSQIMFKISGAANAHAGTAIGSSYNGEVCFDNYFSGSVGGGSNTMLKLSASTNAHAEGPSGSIYNTLVTYGDLVCELRSDKCEGYTLGGDKSSFIVSLSSNTNAHVALSNRYPNSLCCVSPGDTPICDYDSSCESGENPNNCPHDCPLTSSCGDGVVDSGESCDGSSLGVNDCTTIGGGFTGGTLGCTALCAFDTSQCTGGGPPPGGGGGVCSPTTYDSGGNTYPISSCDDYNKVSSDANVNKNACEKDCYGVNIKDPLNRQTATAGGACVWKASDNKCVYSKTTGSGPTAITCSIFPVGAIPECTEGQTSRNVVYESEPDGCDAGCGVDQLCDIDVPCPRVLQLPFFSGFSFVLSLSILFVVYLFYSMKRK